MRELQKQEYQFCWVWYNVLFCRLKGWSTISTSILTRGEIKNFLDSPLTAISISSSSSCSCRSSNTSRGRPTTTSPPCPHVPSRCCKSRWRILAMLILRWSTTRTLGICHLEYSPLSHLCPPRQASDRIRFLFLPLFCDLPLGASAIHGSFCDPIEPNLAEFCLFRAKKTRATSKPGEYEG